MKLIEEGNEVVVVDNLEKRNNEEMNRIEKIKGREKRREKGDIRDREIMEKMIKRNKWNEVINFEGMKEVGE